MAIDLNEYISLCCKLIDRYTRPQVGLMEIRRPGRPVLVTFLGTHPAEGLEKYHNMLEMGWPTNTTLRELEMSYATAEEFRQAIETENAEGITAIDRAIAAQCAQRGFTDPNVLMVYFIDFNHEDADAFLALLNRSYTTPIGNDKARLIFGVGKTTSKRTMERAGNFIDQIRAYAGESPRLWERTSCILLSDYKFSGFTVSEDEFTDNYALAVDILLMLCSVSSDQDRGFTTPVLARVTEAGDSFMTASVCHINKPTYQIARTVLYSYFQRGTELAGGSNRQGGITNQTLRTNAEEKCHALFGQLQFPTPGAMLHFPGGASRAADVQPGSDRTCGGWRVFCETYFLEPVRALCRDGRQLEREFAAYFSSDCGYSCNDILQSFPAFSTYLEENRNGFLNPQPLPQNSTLYEMGLYEAKLEFKKLVFDRLKAAIETLTQEAGGYGNQMSMLMARATPDNASVRSFYTPRVTAFLNGSEDLERELKYPCSEEELRERLTHYVETITSQQADLKMDFVSELKTRLNAAEAQNTITNLLELPDARLEAEARLRAGILSKMANTDIHMFDSTLLPDIHPNATFMLRGTDSIERVALYSFKPTDFLAAF
ncbi:MAG: hypothetical protein LUD79_04630 [Oscillospiraceae bacterium]|nr:hypothetical protein [Oscillospiraceae bacterium]